MNTKDMSIQRTGSGFIVSYSCNVIHQADVNCNLGSIVFYYTDGHVVTVDVSEYVELGKAYNSQFGITLTDDGMLFFVQNWESGLFCFDAHSGKLLWHNEQKKAFHIATKENTVMCHYPGKCVSLIDAQTGDNIRKYPLSTVSIFKPLSAEYYLVGPKRGYYEILDYNLNRHAKLPIADLNPNDMDNFIIQEAALTEMGIVIAGVEYSATEFMAAMKAKQSDSIIERSRFVRQVPVSLA